MTHPTRLATACSLASLAFVVASCGALPADAPYARAKQMQRLDEGIGGPKAMGRPGDFLLENDHARFVILGAVNGDGSQRHSMGPGLYGGSIVDVDLQRDDPRFERGNGMDQFAEAFPTVSMNIAETALETDVYVVADGSDGGPATVRASGSGEPFLNLLGALWALVGQPKMRMTTDYTLEPGVPWLTMTTRVTLDPPAELAEAYEDAEPVESYSDTFPLLDYAIETGLVMGDFYLSGGSVDVFVPGVGFDEDGLVYEANLAGANTFTSPFQFPFVAGVADGVSYGIAATEGDLFVPLFTSSQTVVVGGGLEGDTRPDADRFPEGATYSYERLFFVGDGDVGSILDQVLEARGTPRGHVAGTVTERGTGLPVSGVSVLVFEPGAEAPFSQWRTDVGLDDTQPDGSFEGDLPVGEWELLVHRLGRPSGERIPVTVAEGGEVEVALESLRPGTFHFQVVDERDRWLPSKVTLFRVTPEGGADSQRNPVYGDGFIGGEPEAVLFAAHGQGEAELVPGTYIAVASRGMEYEVETSQPFTVDATRGHEARFVLEHSVQTDGWISADLHVHSSPSHDSGVSLRRRVETMVAEGVDFFASTDHDVITDFAPVVEAMGLEDWVRTAVGVETTTVEVGHFLAFPMQRDWLADAGGALDWTGRSPRQIIGDLEDQGEAFGTEPFIFVGHPRAGILGYFDQYKVDPYGGVPGVSGQPGEIRHDDNLLIIANPMWAPENNFTTRFDGMEVFGGKDFEFIRTPTAVELEQYAAYEAWLKADDGTVPPPEVTAYDVLIRTLEEQRDLDEGVYRLGFGHEGQLDDWFQLLNLGFRYTALGNSDTHGTSSIESGLPRNFVLTGVDDPTFLDPQDVAEALREHKVVASYGPFVRLWVNGQGIGSDVVLPVGDPTANLVIDVQAPGWMDVDRVALYENGTLVEEFEVPDSTDPARFQVETRRSLDRDAWYVAVASGEEGLGPVFTPVERPKIDLEIVVTEALGGIPAISTFLDSAPPIPRTFPVYPFAVTNPIWVDLDDDGFDAPGTPAWLKRPIPPEEPDEE